VLLRPTLRCGDTGYFCGANANGMLEAVGARAASRPGGMKAEENNQTVNLAGMCTFAPTRA